MARSIFLCSAKLTMLSIPYQNELLFSFPFSSRTRNMYRMQPRRISKEDVRQWKISNSQLPDPRGFPPRMMGYTFNYDRQKWEALLPELPRKPPSKPALELPTKEINVKEKTNPITLISSPISDKFNDPTHNKTVIITKPIDTS